MKGGEEMKKVLDVIKSFLGKMSGADGYSYHGNIPLELYYKEFALQSCISILANSIVLSEFQTFEKGIEVQKSNHYMLNIEPNKNQNAVEFWKQAIAKLIYENECLIVQVEEELFVADSFAQKEYVHYEDVYENVVVRGLPFNNTKLKESDVIYLKLNDENIKKLIDGLYSDYGKLLSNSIAGYKRANGRKGILNIKSTFSQRDDHNTKMQDLMENKFKKYFESDNAVLPLQDGLEFQESKVVSNVKDSRDIRNLVNDVIDFVCSAIHIPSCLVKGDISGLKEPVDALLMLGTNPVVKLITCELNRKLYGKENYINRTYVKVDTQKIKNIDMKEMSSAGDVLFRIGVHSINDNLKMMNKEPIKEAWADEHYVTKNYQSVLSINDNNKPVKGGEKNDTNNGEKNSKS